MVGIINIVGDFIPTEMFLDKISGFFSDVFHHVRIIKKVLYSVLKIFTGKARHVHWIIYLFSGLFVIKFIVS